MNLFTYIKAFAYSAVVFTPLIIGAYFYGRSDGHAIAVSEQRAANERIQSEDAELRAQIDANNRKSIEENLQTESENDAVQQSLDAPEIGDGNPFAGDGWVRDLKRLK